MMKAKQETVTGSRTVASEWRIKFTSDLGVEWLEGYSRLQDAIAASKRILKNHPATDELAKCEFFKVI